MMDMAVSRASDLSALFLSYSSSYSILGRHMVDFLEETLETNIFTELQVSDDAPVIDRIGR